MLCSVLTQGPRFRSGTISCNQETGILPPISDDCQTIQNAVTILEGTMSPTFLVQPNHLTTLTFGTCSYFFENMGYSELTACWSDLVWTVFIVFTIL